MQDLPVGICFEIQENLVHRWLGTRGSIDRSIKRPKLLSFPDDLGRPMSSFAHLTQPPVDYWKETGDCSE
jgi:hypothetical protein